MINTLLGIILGESFSSPTCGLGEDDQLCQVLRAEDSVPCQCPLVLLRSLLPAQGPSAFGENPGRRYSTGKALPTSHSGENPFSINSEIQLVLSGKQQNIQELLPSVFPLRCRIVLTRESSWHWQWRVTGEAASHELVRRTISVLGQKEILNFRNGRTTSSTRWMQS